MLVSTVMQRHELQGLRSSHAVHVALYFWPLKYDWTIYISFEVVVTSFLSFGGNLQRYQTSPFFKAEFAGSYKEKKGNSRKCLMVNWQASETDSSVIVDSL